MPTLRWLPRFRADFNRLTPTPQAAFLAAVAPFVKDLRSGGRFRKGLRVKGVKGATGIFEMTWADDGRATIAYGDLVVEGESVRPGEPYIIWRRVGTHAIFKQP